METPNIRLKVENFRAINKADVVIDGITLVAGENGSGKSSLSKLLYCMYRTISNYEILVRSKIAVNLRDVLRFFDIAVQELVSWDKSEIKNRNEFRNEIMDLRVRLYNIKDPLDAHITYWFNTIDKLEKLYKVFDNKESSKSRVLRLNYIVSDILKNTVLSNNKVLDEELPFDLIKKYVKSEFDNANENFVKRPTSIFIEELQTFFTDGKLPKKFEVFEYENLIVSLKLNHLAIPFNIQNVIYIDTPMLIGIEDSKNRHWDDVNNLLARQANSENKYSTQISNEIIHGIANKDNESFASIKLKFNRSDGQVFNLLDVATGIKSFSILQLLLNNGLLNDKTLLIIDEPESHLHPQWIVEYARIIVKLNKELGVKFFLASHNPDMVSAIRYISEKEETLDKVNFYLAKESKKKFQYDYKDLKHDIEPIFESFNIAIDRINKYGA